MSTVGSTNTATSGSLTGNKTTGSSATNAMMANYNTFLSLLTTQLRTQNPLEPMDADKFTQQLVQYSAVEQQIQTNDKLTNMLSTLTSNAALQLVNYLGKDVTAYSDTTKFQSGKASWSLNSGEAVTGAEVTITNSAGAVVYKGTTALTKGANSYSWDGKGTDGTDWSKSDDTYTISVSATNSKGTAVDVTTEISGTVKRVDTSSSQPFLEINGSLVPLSSLISIGTTS
ncbi:flagellar hook assembly protein FlgD [Oryzibacter oryziterrae]|uniref:flagellar hook assembly protein FlgD n=1 Tax=Oryzibacter oryziterrae TaxID=2766474 RepID=UPI001F3C2A5E|nr:flagellar hook capping FlgD N-terminal domain-containing protein [Oryzibacter oryziterrae]